MTKVITSFLLFILFWLPLTGAKACDACGCALGGFNFGTIPQNDSHFVGIRYAIAQFYAEQRHGREISHSYDRYQRVDLMARIALSDRWQLNMVLPYMYNTMEGSHESEQLSGLADPMLMLNYKLLDQKGNPMERWLHNLWFGGGVKAPLAEFRFSRTEELVNPNFQLGSGSWDYVFLLNYTAMRKHFGLHVEAVYKYNTLNSQAYRFGNQYNMQTNLFYKSALGQWQLFPSAGLYHEFGGQHSHEGFLQGNSGGRLTMAQAGVQVQRGNWMMHANGQLPVAQHFFSDAQVEIQAKTRFAFTFVRFIGKKADKSVFNWVD
ncbi:hypothetical protein A3SI_01706 [Nitritalea halalkaliphila LW7]|uniref:Transporter n=1 Tax=Nitritalea halalkaliphila LW7 TaxID=1189621 RepID=I5CA93_9BACT|nr:transporter [Nitritalea halalkaliphila]EIM78745.1 hypothetical protein A3SI_01706 [Nitritalea halalkaliphila LW7]